LAEGVLVVVPLSEGLVGDSIDKDLVYRARLPIALPLIILAKQTGCFAPGCKLNLKHWRAFAFVRPKSADKFMPPVSRVVVDLAG
jgi:hypothetical protein